MTAWRRTGCSSAPFGPPRVETVFQFAAVESAFGPFELEKHPDGFPDSGSGFDAEIVHDVAPVHVRPFCRTSIRLGEFRDSMFEVVHGCLDSLEFLRIAGRAIATNQVVQISEERSGLSRIPANRRIGPAVGISFETTGHSNEFSDVLHHHFVEAERLEAFPGHTCTNGLVVAKCHTLFIDAASSRFADIMKECSQSEHQIRSSLRGYRNRVGEHVLVSVDGVLFHSQERQFWRDVIHSPGVEDLPERLRGVVGSQGLDQVLCFRKCLHGTKDTDDQLFYSRCQTMRPNPPPPTPRLPPAPSGTPLTPVDPPSRSSTDNPIAVAGLVVAVLALILSMIVIGGLIAFASFILCIIGLGRSKTLGRGRGVAITGIILSILALLASVAAGFFLYTTLAGGDEIVRNGIATTSTNTEFPPQDDFVSVECSASEGGGLPLAIITLENMSGGRSFYQVTVEWDTETGTVSDEVTSEFIDDGERTILRLFDRSSTGLTDTCQVTRIERSGVRLFG